MVDDDLHIHPPSVKHYITVYYCCQLLYCVILIFSCFRSYRIKKRTGHSSLLLPEADGAVDPALSHGPLSQAEAMPQSVEHFNLRIGPVVLYPADVILHRAVGGNPVAGPHAGVGGRRLLLPGPRRLCPRRAGK